MTTVKHSVTRNKFRISDNCARCFETVFYKNPTRLDFHCVEPQINVKVEVNADASPIHQILCFNPSILTPETVKKGLKCSIVFRILAF
jgi:hypothetical protein